ncbi:glucose PTS transporter subunit IIA [Companilactobacillus bobalius]|uniref:PTS system sucrose-specific EIIBCA component n=2 Tax=Companilactobacillus bobalius TaxID=2801451 RepID=A0A202F9I7_9LACO|nr:PTS glucose transporter subunit IIABC [Companilactobacillus bobalius]GEO58610.1 PTS beta-glucoside transporter subunit IIABC [Companilactobacillus paralimentarius]KAE9561527.1 PTS beta-glucoside transporter subunit IIABC [Companilactobacillus bobalius]KAE9563603.1 PTS beta-glucoside transporter subunit IIABC [Companilactobacillus bobalius]KRK82422.1 beta-glucosides PTS, EIIABC [Companilactobacillus bobalius DSM 19674]OVE97093.1 Protein-N(pi)-phosphohistidine--sugar phosphotransferase [Compa
MNNQTLVSLAAPVDGRLIKLSQVKDPVFSQGLMGQGFAIEPVNGNIVSPVTGTVTLVSETKHAFGIKTQDGVDVLIHLGIDTVELKGEPFSVLISQGDQIEAGQAVVKMDLKMIEDAGKQKTVILAITNSNDILKQLMTSKFDQDVKSGTTVAVASIEAVATKKKIKIGNGKYDQLAADIVENVGGTENINSLIHCITRLRFYLKDDTKANDQKIENMDGVISVAKAGGQYQVVIGQAVTDVYDAVIAQIGSEYANNSATAEAVAQTTKEANQPKDLWSNVKSGISNFIGVLTASMIPIIGILAGSGILKGILAALTGFKVLSTTSGTYVILNAVGDATFYFLPVVLGFTAAKKLGSDPIVLAIVGGIIIYPSLVTMAGKASTASTTFLGIPTTLVSYTSSVFPIIVAAWLGKYVEKFLKKIIPLYLRSVFVPIIEALILSLVIIIGVGPIITVLSKGLSNGLVAIYSFSPTLSGLVLGGVYQTMVIFGLHWGLIPIIINDIATNGHSYINAIVSITMVAQGGAVLAVFLKTKDKKLKEVSLAAAISAFCGVTEPALYGVNLKYKRIFVVASIASALGGALTGFLKVNNYALSGSLIGFPAFITPGVGIGSNFYGYLISHYGTLVISVVLVYLFGFTDKMLAKKADPMNLNVKMA